MFIWSPGALSGQSVAMGEQRTPAEHIAVTWWRLRSMSARKAGRGAQSTTQTPIKMRMNGDLADEHSTRLGRPKAIHVVQCNGDSS